MPQKYGKGLKLLPGFKEDREVRKQIDRAWVEQYEHRATKRRLRKFMAEPEELKTLEALKRLTPEHALNAAESLLIARVARRKGLVR